MMGKRRRVEIRFLSSREDGRRGLAHNRTAAMTAYWVSEKNIHHVRVSGWPWLQRAILP